jgi:NAD(P)-dependent dehydrogenase (short-subunit alcohol dehydrogenase family)
LLLVAFWKELTLTNNRKIALVTGANKGIGLETARQLGQQHIVVLVGSRDRSRGQKATDALRSEAIDARLLLLDVTNQATIDAAALRIEQEFGKLDILVNNAGIFLEKVPASQCQLENLRKTFETNFFGAFAVTKALLPLLRKSTAGRIVNLASDLASLANTSDPNWALYPHIFFSYSSSKVAINAMTVALAKELQGTAIKVNSADPGFTATDMNNFTGPKPTQQAARVPVRLATLPPDGPTGGYFDENGPVPW